MPLCVYRTHKDLAVNLELTQVPPPSPGLFSAIIQAAVSLADFELIAKRPAGLTANCRPQ